MPLSTRNTQKNVNKQATQVTQVTSNQVHADRQVHADEMVKAIAQLPVIQESLSEINGRLKKLEHIETVFNDTKEDIWGPDGLDHQIKETAELAVHNESDIHELRSENASLKRELQLLKAVVINMDRKLTTQGNQITELKMRSMRDNILIHNLAENESENLENDIPLAIKAHLGVDVQFVRIHRNGTMNSGSIEKPRSITGKLVDRQKKFDLLKAQRIARKAEKIIPFSITPQTPPELYEQRKKQEDVSTQMKNRGITTHFSGNKLLFADGSAYKEKIQTPRAEDVLTVDSGEREHLAKIETKSTKTIVETGNKFKGTVKKVKSINEVRDVYKKVISDPQHATANHNVLVYRTEEEDGFCDDREFGAGKRLLKQLRDNDVKNIVVVVSRWYRGPGIGAKRFELFEQVVNDAVHELEKE